MVNERPDEPATPRVQWLDEIRLAIKDARGTKPFGCLVGQRITDANLFHLAPLVCLKFRGRKHDRQGGESGHRNGAGELRRQLRSRWGGPRS